MKKLLMLLVVAAGMGVAGCSFMPPGPPMAGEAFGRYCPPGVHCVGFPAMEHGGGGSSSGS